MDTFDAINLKENLLRGIYAYGFEKPSEIQQKSIPRVIEGRDIIAQAQSGTGKTGAFTISTLQLVDFTLLKCQAIILSPTRELAKQTYDVLNSLGGYLSDDDYCKLGVGGTRLSADIGYFKYKQPLILIGTPGRVYDYIQRGLVKCDNIKLFILDEADELLSQGFTQQIHDIFKCLPSNTQVALYSATMPPEVVEISKKFMKSPIHELVKKEELSLKGIKQFYLEVDEQYKLETLAELYDHISVSQSIVFCNTKKKAIWLAEKMDEKQFTVSLIHSDMTKDERSRIIEIFRSGASRVLVATDIIARGLDVHHVNIVVNYDISMDRESYIHRIGRAGRYGRKGIAINFTAPKDKPLITDLEKFYKINIDELTTDFYTYLE